MTTLTTQIIKKNNIDTTDYRLTTDNYNRPYITYTDSLTNNEIKHLLEDYTKVKDISLIEKGTHIRYFSKNNNGEYQFRTGGVLKINNEPDKFIILNNGRKSWSVQTKDTIFYSKVIINKIYANKNDKSLQIKQLIDFHKNKLT